MKKIILWILIPIATIGSLFSLGLFLKKEGVFTITQVDLEILEVPSCYMSTLNKRIGPMFENSRGQYIWDFDVASETDKLLKEDWVDKVSLRRIWPNHIRAQISTKKISANLMINSNIFIPVANDGSLFPRALKESVPDFPVMVGKEFVRDLDSRKNAITQLEGLPKTGNFTSQAVSEVYLDSSKKIWITLIKNSIAVRLGEDRPELKAERVSQVLDYLTDKQMDARVIDADFSKKVLVKPRNRR